jgi:hypothetical protein
MKRTDTIFKTVTATAVAMAITAGPAFGSTGDPSPSPNSWGSTTATEQGYSSVNATLYEPAQSVKSVTFGVGHSSVNASVNEPTTAVAIPAHSSVLASVNEPTTITPVPAGSSVSSIVGSPPTAPVETATVVHDESGFDWTDAFIGAIGALTLALLSAAAVHTLRRRERMSLGSQV